MNPTEDQISQPGLSATALRTSEQRLEEERIVAAVREYLAALETGEEPDRAEFLARHPAIAEELTDCLEGLEFVHQLGPRTSPHDGSPEFSSSSAGHGVEVPLGDYRIVREIGHGGMGVVYEAVQLSLGRRVALKILPFAAALDARQLQRFKNEAQAAALLHHTNIVPIHGVGVERGIHYYAMQFIEGKTLAALIEEFRQKAGLKTVNGTVINSAADVATETPRQPATVSPSSERASANLAFCRMAAGLGVQAAEALEHAHQSGVIHRDVKPGNLLVDGRGNLWITDFGLAHMQSHAALTMTGDLVGTLRYMSPEQALAKRVIVDHRTDVYSLGATLYELLTLEPVFRGSDRQELLRQIAFEEPRKPRCLDRAIPPELETIVLKAIEKNPDERYATAQELADDLNRYLEDKPIRAKRPTWAQRFRKFARRHQSVVLTVALAAVLLLGVTALLLWTTNLRISDEQNLTLKEWHRAEEALKAQENQRERAEANLKTALEAFDRLFMKPLGHNPDKPPDQNPNQNPFRRTALQEAEHELLRIGLDFYERFAQNNSNSPFLLRETLKAFERAAEIAAAVAQWDKREIALAKAIPIVDQLAQEYPNEPKHMHNLCRLLHGRAIALRSLGRLPQAKETMRWGLAASKKLVTTYPKEPKYGDFVNYSCNFLARLCAETGQLTEAREVYQQVLSFQEQLAGDFPDLPDHRSLVGDTCWHYATILRDYGEPEKARALVEKAIEHQQQALHASPNHPMSRLRLRLADFLLARTLTGLGRHREAADTAAKITLDAQTPGQGIYWTVRCLSACALLVDQNAGWSADERAAAVGIYLNQSRQLAEKTRQQSPSDWQVCNDLAWFLATCPDTRFRDAEAAVALAEKATQAAPGQMQPWNTLGAAYYRAGNWKAAIAALKRSMQLGKADKYDPWNWIFLAMAHWQAGDKKQALQWSARVSHWLENHRTESEEFGRFRAEAAHLLGQARLQHSFSGHGMGIPCVVLSPDGRQAASASFDGTLCLWDLETGREVRRFRDNPGFDTGFMTTVAYSPDGRRLASGGHGLTLQLWDVQTGRLLRRFWGHTGPLPPAHHHCLTFSSDGRYLFSGNQDQTVRKWDVDTGKEVRRFDLHADDGNFLAFSPDSRHYLSGHSGRSLRLWHLESGKEVRHFEGDTGLINRATFSLDGRRVLSTAETDKTLRVWDAETGRQLRRLDVPFDIRGQVALSSDGRRALMSGKDATVRVWDLEEGRELYRYEGHGDHVWASVFMPDGRRVLSGGTDNLLQLWELPAALQGGKNAGQKAGTSPP
jgi:serine/threonine protein kinase/WD40 repeat protein